MSEYSRDALAEWFLRLNGFFTVLNFVVHPVEAAEGSQQRTDADVLGVRFPARREIVGGEALRDHDSFGRSPRLRFVIAEVKRRVCKLNGPWTRPDDDNVGHVLRSFGIDPKLHGQVSHSLYEKGHYVGDDFEATLLCFGSRASSNLRSEVLQFTWSEVFGFVYDRYQEFWQRKKLNQQWPPIGRLLWDKHRERDRDAYIREMLKAFDVELEA